MTNFITNFIADEDGAVTVDFVVLTAAIVLLGGMVLGNVSSDASAIAQDIKANLEAQGDAINP